MEIILAIERSCLKLGKIGIRKAEKQIRENEETQRLLTAGSSYAPREW